MDTGEHEDVLVVCASGHVCAIPLAIVDEIMRPLPTDPLPDVPPFLRGLAVIRGAPVPVLDLARLLGMAESPAAKRFAVLRLNDRRVALACEDVPGLRSVGSSLVSLSRLLDAARPDLVAGVGVDDQSLLFVLEVARIVPESLWRQIESRAVTA
jgi:purine-binding chemotaxis protein CheW